MEDGELSSAVPAGDGGNMSKIVNLLERLPWHKTKRWPRRRLSLVRGIALHCTGSGNQDPFVTNAYHISTACHISSGGIPRIAYHEFIDDEGTRYLCNEHHHRTYHCGLWNRWTLGVVMAGPGQREPPTVAQMQTTLGALVELCLRRGILPKKVRGHREWRLLAGKKLKACPGKYVNMDAVRLVVCVAMQQELRDVGLYFGGIDGKFGRKSKAALKRYVWAEDAGVVTDTLVTPEEAEQCIRVKG